MESITINGLMLIKVYLCGKKKIKFLMDDSAVADAKNSEDWWSENSLVMTWLWLSIEPHVLSNVQLLDIAKKIWTYLKEMYSQE